MPDDELELYFRRWKAAGLLDDAALDRLRRFEAGSRPPQRPGLLAGLALGVGALMVGAGLLLLVAAHWDQLPPALQFPLVLAMVALPQATALAVQMRWPALASVMRAIATLVTVVALILTARLFALQGHWPTQVLLAALAAAAGCWALRDWPQRLFLMLFAPAWPIAEWMYATRFDGPAERIPVLFALLLALVYLVAEEQSIGREASAVLQFTGGVLFIPLYLLASGLAREPEPVGTMLALTGWLLAIAIPVLLSLRLRWWPSRRRSLWPLLAFTLWAAAVLELNQLVPGGVGLTALTVLRFVLGLAGGIGLIVWGSLERAPLRINLGTALILVAVLVFYFSSLVGRLERSTSLIGFGLLFLALALALERLRRRFLRRIASQPATPPGLTPATPSPAAPAAATSNRRATPQPAPTPARHPRTLLAAHLILVSLLAGQYAWQRQFSPRAWMPLDTADWQLPISGSAYLQCWPRVEAMAPNPPWNPQGELRVRLVTANGRVRALADPHGSVLLERWQSTQGPAARLERPIQLFLSRREQAELAAAPHLCLQVSVPSSGPPRPLHLALRPGS